MVWLRPPESDSHNTGHVMVIGGKPTATSLANERLIPVIDSTRITREGWEPRLFRARGKTDPCGFNRLQCGMLKASV